MADALTVMERFHSVQGEGWWSGSPMIFVRFSKCNLSCCFCDSSYASHPEKGRSKEYWGQEGAKKLASVIRAMMLTNNCTKICFTGGEPTIQPAGLMMWLLRELGSLATSGIRVWFAVETNGTKCPTWLEEVNWITVSPKEIDPEAYFRDYSYAEEVKVVLAPEQEIPNFLGTLPENRFIMPMTRQPFADNLEFNLESYSWAAQKVMESDKGWRLTGRLQELAKIR